MPYPTVLPTANEQAHIYQHLVNINNALFQFNQTTGFACPMPTEIEFQYIAIDQFQALAVQTVEGGTNTELQTGTDTQQTNGTTSDTSNQTTTHGETVNTTDGESTEYIGYDPTVALSSPGDYTASWPTVGLQAQPFPL